MEPAGELAARLGLPANARALLERALIHGSFTNEHPEEPGGSNERLEFLGDAVVSLVISEALFTRHPEEDEGALTARRAALVSTRALARVTRRLHLDELIVLGQGAERTGERGRASVQFFFYTMVGSVALLLAFLALYLATGTYDFTTLAQMAQNGGLAAALQQNLHWGGWSGGHIALILFWAVFLGFAVKTPVVPFHGWLPATYAEA